MSKEKGRLSGRLWHLSFAPGVAATLVLLLPTILGGAPLAQDRRVKPSLDRLVQRVETYWNYLAQGKKSSALEYVEPGSRDAFLDRQVPTFTLPRLVRLEPSTKDTEVTVTLEVQRVISPQIATPMPWPVTEKWVFLKGNWFVVVSRSPYPFARPAEGSPPPSAEELAQWKKIIQDRLRFQTTELDFGTVRRGTPAHATLKYQLSGNESLDFRFLNNPGDLVVLGMQDWKFSPVESGTIDLELQTGERDGIVEQPFTLAVYYRSASVPFKFVLRGSVYSPISAAPWSLTFENKEVEKEVLVRNNSQTEARIASAYSEGSRFEATPVPSTIGPGETLNVKIRLLSRPANKNYRETLTLILERPIEGMKNLSIPVLLNPEAPAKKGPAVLTPQGIEKLVPKKPPMPPL